MLSSFSTIKMGAIRLFSELIVRPEFISQIMKPILVPASPECKYAFAKYNPKCGLIYYNYISITIFSDGHSINAGALSRFQLLLANTSVSN